MGEEKHRILLVEDDPATAAGIVRGLRRAGFEVELLCDGEGAEGRAMTGIDLVVLDLMLPGRGGEDLLRRIRARSAVPVIVVTARTELSKRLEVFALGAVDYLPKPFFVEELVARIQSRLGESPGRRRQVQFGAVIFDLEARTLVVSGTHVHITATEQAILAYLVKRPGRAVARHELAAALPDSDDADARNLDAHLARLRKKLGDDAVRIVTVWGYGYRFDAPNAKEGR